MERICPECGRDYGSPDDYPDDNCMVCNIPLRVEGQTAMQPGGYLADVISRAIAWPPGEEPERVYIARDYMEGQIIKSLLESADIPVFVQSDSAGRFYSVGGFSAVSRVSVSVPHSRRSEAAALLRQTQGHNGEEINNV